MNKTKLLFLAYTLFSLILIGGLSIWAITQKVEADKQKDLALIARDNTIKAEEAAMEMRKIAEKTKDQEQRTRIEYLKALDEVVKQKALYEACRNVKTNK